jgi:hypothetical protein
MTKEQLDSVLAIIDGYDARMKLVREYFDRREPVPEKYKQYLAALDDAEAVKAFEALRPLVARIRELERQRDWLADALQTICAWHKDYGSCPVDHVCPGADHCLYGGLVTSGDWIEKAERAAKEAGE